MPDGKHENSAQWHAGGCLLRQVKPAVLAGRNFIAQKTLQRGIGKYEDIAQASAPMRDLSEHEGHRSVRCVAKNTLSKEREEGRARISVPAFYVGKSDTEMVIGIGMVGGSKQSKAISVLGYQMVTHLNRCVQKAQEMFSSTASLWQNISAVHLRNTRQSITLTGIAQTIGSKIYNCEMVNMVQANAFNAPTAEAAISLR